ARFHIQRARNSRPLSAAILASAPSRPLSLAAIALAILAAVGRSAQVAPPARAIVGRSAHSAAGTARPPAGHPVYARSRPIARRRFSILALAFVLIGQIAQHFFSGQEPVAIAVHLLKLFQIAAGLLPFV